MIICIDTNVLVQARASGHAYFPILIITEDHHFSPLATAGYHPRPITPTEFISRYLSD